MFNFEKLEIWQKAIEFADDLYRITKSFPADERFGLTNQMRRAAVSIAEGTSRSSRMAYARFVEIATGSLFEDVSHSFIARRQGFLSDKDFQHLYHLTEDQSRMLSGLRTYLIGNRADH